MHKRKTLFITGVLLLMSTLSSCKVNPQESIKQSEDIVERGTKYKVMEDYFYNPMVIDFRMGDPWLYYHDGYYYYTQSEGTRVRVTKSPYMTQLTSNPNDETRTKILFRQKSIDVVEIWAPEIFFFEGHWYIYFTATKDAKTEIEKDTGRRTYGMKSVTDDAFGEWETPVEIKLPMDYRSIDATFLDYDGRQYIIWSGWPNAENLNWRQNLYITELVTGNPLLAKSTADTERHIISVPHYEWENSSIFQNEGPSAIISPDGTPIIFYAGNFSGDDSYCVGYITLTGTDLTNFDHWTKNPEPLMATDMAYSEIIAPGHCSIVKSPDQTEWWIMYHSAKYSGAGWDRMARLQKMEWVNGKPHVEKITKIADPNPLPSGEVGGRQRLYEAEDAVLTEDCFVIDKEGYAAGDNAVSISENGSITFEIGVPANGPYVVGIRFSNRDSSLFNMNVTVNGNEMLVYAPRTQYDDSFTIAYFFTDLYIKREGLNTISINADPSIYIDCLILDLMDHK